MKSAAIITYIDFVAAFDSVYHSYQHQSTIEKVSLGNEKLDNVYTFVYLGAAIATDGDRSTALDQGVGSSMGTIQWHEKYT